MIAPRSGPTMNPGLLELALKKQRLQLKAAADRVVVLHALEKAAPAFRVADRTARVWSWIKAHPHWPVGIGVALFVARPRVMMRWSRRAFVAWQALRRLRKSADALLPATPPP